MKSFYGICVVVVLTICVAMYLAIFTNERPANHAHTPITSVPTATSVFPAPFPPIQSTFGTSVGIFVPGRPYRVLQIREPYDGEIKLANVEEPNGSTFITSLGRVTSLKPGTFFMFGGDMLTGIQIDELVVVDEKNINPNLESYYGYTVGT